VWPQCCITHQMGAWFRPFAGPPLADSIETSARLRLPAVGLFLASTADLWDQ
jgi:hypothetical protein